MTVEEIVNELEGLKDYTNDHGKGVLENLKHEVRKLTEPKPTFAALLEKPVEPKPEPKAEPVKAEPVEKPEPVKAHKTPVKKWPAKKK